MQMLSKYWKLVRDEKELEPITDEEWSEIKIASEFICCFYSNWFSTSSVTVSATVNDVQVTDLF